MLNVCANFHKNRTCTIREITSEVTNERTHQQTCVIIIPPGRGSNFIRIRRYLCDVTHLGLGTVPRVPRPPE